MKNREKAEALGKIHARQYHHNTHPELNTNSEFVFSNNEIEIACNEMAEWMIEKAVTWLALHAEMYGGFNYGKLNEMVENFKQAMEE